jgi:hypothetical protein
VLATPTPADPAEFHYDQALTPVDTEEQAFDIAVDLLRRELGAEVLARTG